MTQRLYRSDDDKIIAGLCGGMGEFFDLDPTIIRIIFVILTIWGGVGVILYIIGVLVVPVKSVDTDNTEKKPKNTDFSEKINEIAQDIRENVKKRNKKSFRVEMVIGLMIILFGVLLFVEKIVPAFGLDLFWPIILIILGFYFLIGRSKEGEK